MWEYRSLGNFGYELRCFSTILWSNFDNRLFSVQIQVISVQLMEGDIIVMGSDGLFDNIFNSEILSTVSKYSDVAETGN